MKFNSAALSVVFSLIFCGVTAQNNKMSLVKGGVYLPLYGAEDRTVKVEPFLMDVYPVTNEDFLKFVEENPQLMRILKRKS